MNVKQLIEVLKDLDENMEIATIVGSHYSESVNNVSFLECHSRKYVVIGDQSSKNINGENAFISKDFYGKTVNNCPFFMEI